MFAYLVAFKDRCRMTFGNRNFLLVYTKRL
jgi:hypothetical protein